MYEQSARWNEYYRELEPKKRLKLRNELFMLEPDDGANEYRKFLYEIRYTDPKNPKEERDLFLWHCINFPFIFRNARVFKGFARKELRGAIAELHLADAAEYGEAGERALYWEIRNTAKRYFSTTESGSYRKKLFGMMNSAESERNFQRCKDCYEMSEGVAKRLGMETELSIWVQAVEDEFICTGENAAANLEDYRKEMESKL